MSDEVLVLSEEVKLAIQGMLDERYREGKQAGFDLAWEYLKRLGYEEAAKVLEGWTRDGSQVGS